MTDLEALVPQDHLLRKVEKVMDYEWLYEKLDAYYCHDNGRPGIDPVVLIKMALIQHLFGIPSLRQTYRDIIVNLAYRWFLGYGLLEEIPHFSTVSYAFCHRFPEDLTMEIFEHILNKALNNRMVDPRTVFIDGTHIKASANKKKYQKEQVAKAAMDAAYKTPWIAKKILEDGRIPIMPYTRYKGDKERYKPWEYEYDPVTDSFICPQGGVLRHTTTDKEGKRTYRTTPSKCKSCPCKFKCGANEKGQKAMTTHIWQEYLDIVEAIRKTEKGKKIYAQRKETIERVFADAKEKHAMRYTHHRGLAAVTRWVRLKYAAMNLKKLAKWSWENSICASYLLLFPKIRLEPLFSLHENRGFWTV